MYIDPVTLRMLSEERIGRLIKEAELYRRADANEAKPVEVPVQHDEFLNRFMSWVRPNRRIVPRGI
jgi:hypothetical protein